MRLLKKIFLKNNKLTNKKVKNYSKITLALNQIEKIILLLD